MAVDPIIIFFKEDRTVMVTTRHFGHFAKMWKGIIWIVEITHRSALHLWSHITAHNPEFVINIGSGWLTALTRGHLDVITLVQEASLLSSTVYAERGGHLSRCCSTNIRCYKLQVIPAEPAVTLPISGLLNVKTLTSATPSQTACSLCGSWRGKIVVNVLAAVYSIVVRSNE